MSDQSSKRGFGVFGSQKQKNSSQKQSQMQENIGPSESPQANSPSSTVFRKWILNTDSFLN